MGLQKYDDNNDNNTMPQILPSDQFFLKHYFHKIRRVAVYLNTGVQK